MISLDPNWHDCDVVGHLFITLQFNWSRVLKTCDSVWSHVVLIGSCMFLPFQIESSKPLVYGLLLDDAALRQYDVTSFYKTEGCFQALARRTGMRGKCLEMHTYVWIYTYNYIITYTYIFIFTYSFFYLSKLFFSRFSPPPPFLFLCFFPKYVFLCPIWCILSFTFKLQRKIPSLSVGRISSIRSLCWWSVWMLFGSLGSTQWSWLHAGGLYHWMV